MSISASQYINIRCRAEERAHEKYPEQSERRRQMADSECAEDNGPYNLEPLTWSQRIGLVLGLAEYERDPREISFPDIPDMSPPWKHQLRYTYKVLTTGKC